MAFYVLPDEFVDRVRVPMSQICARINAATGKPLQQRHIRVKNRLLETAYRYCF